jgi:hypothetical protein
MAAKGQPLTLWGSIFYLVLSVLWEVTVGHTAYNRLYISEYDLPTAVLDWCLFH